MDAIKTALVGFAAVVLTALSLWLRERNAKKKLAIAKEEEASPERPSKAITISRHALARAELVEGKVNALSAATPTAQSVDAIKAEMRAAYEKRIDERIAELRSELGARVTQGLAQINSADADRIDRWGNGLRSELRTVVRSEVTMALSDSGSGIQPIARASMPSGSGISDESSNDHHISINVMSPPTREPGTSQKRRR